MAAFLLEFILTIWNAKTFPCPLSGRRMLQESHPALNPLPTLSELFRKGRIFTI
ncbi:hypothetical protein [Robiginitalea sp. IMCC43444]|uniref:hypothetical protein n=1 Tax=Robiginitalea sp. IMCC43444 TaxID=3459121 RepID=UPI0040425A48